MRFSPLVLAFAGMLASPTAGAQEIGNAKRGEVMASRLCSECHYTGVYDAESRNAKAAPFRAIANTRGMTAMALGVWMQTSHPTMPNIRLTPETLDDIIAYIRSLKSEPSPSPELPSPH
jgi:mono/diheme cytochrome c family protein